MFCENVPGLLHNEHVGQVLKDAGGQVAKNCKPDTGDNDVSRSVVAAKGLELDSFDDKFQLLSTNQQPDEDRQVHATVAQFARFAAWKE